MNFQKTWTSLLVVAVSVCAALVLCEILLRYVHPQSLGVWTQTRDGLILLRPSLDGYSRKFDTHVRTNSLGFRDVEHDGEASKGTYRVLLLGDSFMEALQVEFEESFPFLLAEGLNNILACPIEVINAGVSGWGSDDQVTYFSRRGKDLNPDLVVIAFTLHNDVSDNLEGRYHLRDGDQLHAKPVTETPLFRHWNLNIRSYMISHSHLYALAYKSLKSIGAAEAGDQVKKHVVDLMMVDPRPKIENGWWITKHLLEETKQQSQLVGAQMAVVPIPLIYQAEGWAYTELLDTSRLSDGQLDPNGPGATLSRILEDANIPRIDLLPGFLEYTSASGSKPLYIRGDGHWNQNGHRVAAVAASRQLAEVIRRTKSSGTDCN